MIRLLALLFFSFACAETFSQQLLISPSAHDDFSLGYSKVIGQDEGGYYVLTSNLSMAITSDRVGFRNRKYKVAYFDLNLNRKWQQDVIEENGEVPDAVGFFNDKVMIVSSSYDKPSSELSFRVGFIGSDGKRENINEPVARFSGVRHDFEKCRIIVASGRNLFALITREFLDEKAGKIHAAIIGEDLQLIGVKSGNVQWPEKTFEFNGYSVSNDGDVVVMGVNSEKIKALSSKRKYDYLVFVSAVNESGFREFNVTADKSITGLGIAFDNVNRRAVLAGFYMEKESFIGAGIYYASLGMNPGDSVTIKTSVINEQQNIRLRGERNRGAGLDLISYPIDRIVPRNDGGAVIVAESAYTTEYSFYDSFSQSFSRRIEYNFDNIIVISVNSSGNADWSAVIEKQQTSLDDGGIFSSFCSMLNSEQLAIVFNDHIGRRNRIIPVTVSNMGKSAVMKPLPQTEAMLILPRGGKQVSENEMVLPALIKRKLHFVKVTF